MNSLFQQKDSDAFTFMCKIPNLKTAMKKKQHFSELRNIIADQVLNVCFVAIFFYSIVGDVSMIIIVGLQPSSDNVSTANTLKNSYKFYLFKSRLNGSSVKDFRRRFPPSILPLLVSLNICLMRARFFGKRNL